MNDCEECVANKIVDGTQCTVMWHPDNLKMSHLKKKAVTKILKLLQKKFGNSSITRGKAHDCLGMVLDFSNPGEVQIEMKHCTKDVIEDFPEEVSGSVSSPAAANLFEVNDEAKKPPKQKAEDFHTIVAKALWV